MESTDPFSLSVGVGIIRVVELISFIIRAQILLYCSAMRHLFWASLMFLVVFYLLYGNSE